MSTECFAWHAVNYPWDKVVETSKNFHRHHRHCHHRPSPGMREMADETSLLRHCWAFLGTLHLGQKENSGKSHPEGKEKYLQKIRQPGMEKKKSPKQEHHTTIENYISEMPESAIGARPSSIEINLLKAIVIWFRTLCFPCKVTSLES